MTKSEELASVENHLLSEYKRLVHLSDEYLNSDGGIDWYNYNLTCGERVAIARLIGYMGMTLPDVENTEC